MAASASAEFFADIALCPMEAAKVRIQTQPGCPPLLRKVAPLIYKDEGLRGYVLFYDFGLLNDWSKSTAYNKIFHF